MSVDAHGKAECKKCVPRVPVCAQNSASMSSDQDEEPGQVTGAPQKLEVLACREMRPWRS